MTKGRCKYPQCKHTSTTDDCSFHMLPSDHTKCRIWMRLCKFDGTPRQLPARIQICSCHFVGMQGPSVEDPHPVAYEPAGNEPDYFHRRKFKSNVSILDRYFSPMKANGGSETVECADEPGTSTNSALCTPPSECVITSMEERDSLSTDHTPLPSPKSGGTIDRDDDSTVSFSVQERGDSFDAAFSTLLANTPDGKDRHAKDTITLGEEFENVKQNILKRRKERSTTEHERSQHSGDSHTAHIQCDFALFSYEQSKSWKESDFVYFTGLRRDSFEILYDLLEDDDCERLKYHKNRTTPLVQRRERSSDARDKLFLTLVRLRRGFSLTDMRMLFKMSEAWISDIFNTWIRLLSIKFESMEEIIFVSAEAQEKNKPDCYAPFPNLRCVVDSTDIKLQKPKNMEQQSNTFSKYHGGNVVKFLVATSVYGGLSFISKGFEGCITDRDLFLRSGIMEHFTPGDAVMTDRGFDIEADLNDIQVELICPPFLGAREEFTAREILEAKSIASSRIHVETFIGRIKYFKLLRHVVPNTMIDVVSDIVKVCANLVNFSDPYINWDSVRNAANKIKRLKRHSDARR